MLAQLRESGRVTQDARTRTYSIGLRAYVIGVRYLSANQLTREALPFLRLAADKSGFTTTLSIMDGFRPLYLFGVEAPVYADFGTRMGEHFPMHASAPGKVLASFCSPDLVDLWIATYGLTRVTANTISEQTDFRLELERIRSRGYSLSRGERAPGLGGIAVPFFDEQGSITAAIGLAYPVSHVTFDQFDYYATILHDVARKLSTRLCMKSYPFGADANRTLGVSRSVQRDVLDITP